MAWSVPFFDVTICHTLPFKCDRVSDAVSTPLAQSELYLGFDKITAVCLSWLLTFVLNQLDFTITYNSRANLLRLSAGEFSSCDRLHMRCYTVNLLSLVL